MTELTRPEVTHLAALREEDAQLAAVNLRIVSLGGQMVPLADGTPAPPAVVERQPDRPDTKLPPERGG